MKTKDKKNKNKEQVNGHAYALIDVIYLPKTKTHYIKLRNSQLSMTIYKEIVDQYVILYCHFFGLVLFTSFFI